jgi:hypothetical protein
MANLKNKTTPELAQILDDFRLPPKPGVPREKRGFNIWRVMGNLLYFFAVIIEFLDRLEDLGIINPRR